MKGLLKKFEKYSMAATFAEENNPQTCREIIGIEEKGKVFNILRFISDNMVAATYAESNCPNFARLIIKGEHRQKTKVSLETFLDTVGLKNIRINYGLVPVV